MSEPKYKVLCVDDEQRVLDALKRHLRDRFEVFTAPGGAEAIDILTAHKDLAVIVSDMRMPEMDGATLLRHARILRPSTVRILLTGQADMGAAIKAVNEGQIFRFLTKPCPPDLFMSVLDEAIRQHELMAAEKILLQRTVVGAIKALTDIMTLVNPNVFGRAQRLKRRVSALAVALKLEDRWKVEAAALLSYLGQVSLPEGLQRKLIDGRELDALEAARVRSAVGAANRIIAHVPRLEPVSALLVAVSDAGTDSGIPLPVEPDAQHIEVLRLALAAERLDGQGLKGQAALDALQASGDYQPALLEALRPMLSPARSKLERVEVAVEELALGMVLDEDVMTDRNVLIVPRGCEVTPNFIEHILQFGKRLSKPTIAILREPANMDDAMPEAVLPQGSAAG